METKHTNRGFARIEFTDQKGVGCWLQKSSLATEDCIWFGCREIGLKKFVPGKGWSDVHLEQGAPGGISHIANTAMHLSQEMVAELLPLLQHFAETGELPTKEPTQ